MFEFALGLHWACVAPELLPPGAAAVPAGGGNFCSKARAQQRCARLLGRVGEKWAQPARDRETGLGRRSRGRSLGKKLIAKSEPHVVCPLLLLVVCKLCAKVGPENGPALIAKAEAAAEAEAEESTSREQRVGRAHCHI